MMQNGRGGLGKLAGGVLLAGMGSFVGGEQHGLHGHGMSTAISRRRFCARNVRAGECAVAVKHGGGSGEEKRGKGGSTAMMPSSSTSGSGGARRSSVAAAAQQRRLRPPGGVRERVE